MNMYIYHMYNNNAETKATGIQQKFNILLKDFLIFKNRKKMVKKKTFKIKKRPVIFFKPKLKFKLDILVKLLSKYYFRV